MSIDIQYIAFDSEKADSTWAFFREEMNNPVVHQKVSNDMEYASAMENWDASLKTELQPYKTALSHIRKKIFTFLDAHNYVIPGFEWTSDEGVGKDGRPMRMSAMDKFEYVLNFGVLYPRNATPEQIETCKKNPILLRNIGYDLEVEYREAMEECHTAEQRLYAAMPQAHAFISPTIYAEKEKTSLLVENEHFDIERIYSNEPIEKEWLLAELVQIDLIYGGVFGSYLDSPKLEWYLFSMLTENTSIQDINIDSIDENTVNSIATELQCSIQEAKEIITQYVQDIQEVIDELKRNSKAILVRFVNQEGAENDEVERMLQDRALQHFKQFKDVLPSVM